MHTELNTVEAEELRPEEERRVPPDRGIVLLDAKDRIGPKIWALYGRVDRPTVLRDDLYVDSSLNDFCRDADGYPFLLLPYVAEDAGNRFEIADAAYRRSVALGVTEKPEIFFTCVYQFQLPEYRCLHIHADRDDQVMEEEKCLRLMEFEKLRQWEELGAVQLAVTANKKILPVSIQCENSLAKPSNNLQFALNTLVLQHGYSAIALQRAWDRI